MKKLLLTAAVAAMSFAAPAFAAPIVIDDFLSSPPNPFTATLNCPGGNCTGIFASDGPDSYSIDGNNFVRSVLFEALADPVAAPQASLAIGGGNLWIGNDPFVKSRTTLTYDISSLDALIPNQGATDFNVMFSDGVAGAASTSIEAIINGVSVGTWTLDQAIPAIDAPAFAGFQFNGGMLTGVGDTLQLIINGPAGYDLVIDRIAVVPEPAMLGLFGLGAIGLTFARRRKK